MFLCAGHTSCLFLFFTSFFFFLVLTALMVLRYRPYYLIIYSVSLRTSRIWPRWRTDWLTESPAAMLGFSRTYLGEPSAMIDSARVLKQECRIFSKGARGNDLCHSRLAVLFGVYLGRRLGACVSKKSRVACVHIINIIMVRCCSVSPIELTSLLRSVFVSCTVVAA